MGKRRAFVDNADDADDAHSFPSALFEAAEGVPESPTKVRQTSSHPRKRKRSQAKISHPNAADASACSTKQAPTQCATQQPSTDHTPTSPLPYPASDQADALGVQTIATETFDSHQVFDYADSFDDPRTDFEPDDDGSKGLEVYADAVGSNVAGFSHISDRIFVVQGWNTVKGESTVSDVLAGTRSSTHAWYSKESWYHLEYQKHLDTIITACSCPKASNGLCIHRLYFKTYEIETFIPNELQTSDSPPAILFLRRTVPYLGLQSLISVQSMSTSHLKGRAVVTHVVSRKGGTWKCSKDQGLSSCYHINKAKEAFPEPEGEELEAALEGLSEEVGDDAVALCEISELLGHDSHYGTSDSLGKPMVRGIPSPTYLSILLCGQGSDPMLASMQSHHRCALLRTDRFDLTRRPLVACALNEPSLILCVLSRLGRASCTLFSPFTRYHWRCNSVRFVHPPDSVTLGPTFARRAYSTSTTRYWCHTNC